MSNLSAGTPVAPVARRPRTARVVILVLIVVVLLLLPLYVGEYWLKLGLFGMAAAVSAIGLVILTGSAGLLSLGHAFFIAVGVYGYAFFAGDGQKVAGLGMPPLAAAVLAVLLTGLFGLAFSPVARRTHGIYLGLATLGLVYIGQHILLNAQTVTGGFNGRSIPEFAIGALTFSDDSGLVIDGTPLRESEMLWYLFLVVTVAAAFFARNLLRGRQGRAWRFMKDSELGAAAMGINVHRAKGSAFVVSSMYAGAGGVLTALAFERAVPQYFNLTHSIDFLAMIIIGGMGSVGGAVAGAAFVTFLPLLLTRYGDVLPFIAGPGESGLASGVASQITYGVLIIIVLMLNPNGLAGFLKLLTSGRQRRADNTEALRVEAETSRDGAEPVDGYQSTSARTK